MSDELNQYLNKMPIHVFKLSDGETIIARLLDETHEEMLVGKPQSLSLYENKGKAELFMNEWLYGCDANDVLIKQDKVIAHNEASLELKNFYSKCILKNTVRSLMSDIDLQSIEQHPFDLFKEFIDALEQQDFAEVDEDCEEEYEEETSDKDFQKRRWEWPSELD